MATMADRCATTTMADRCAIMHKRPPPLPCHPALHRTAANTDFVCEQAKRLDRRHHTMPQPGSGRIQPNTQPDSSPVLLASNSRSASRGEPGNDESCSRGSSKRRSHSLSQLGASDVDQQRAFQFSSFQLARVGSKGLARGGIKGTLSRSSRRPSLSQKAVDETRCGRDQDIRKNWSILDENQDPQRNRSRMRENSKGSASSRNTSCSSCELNEMYGFQVGDKVTASDGPDAIGPWQNLGDGLVCGVGWKPGMLDVIFANGEQFPIRAKNLKKVSEHEKKVASQHDESELFGFKVGDVVDFLDDSSLGGWVHLGGGRGVVMDAGSKPFTILVRFDGIGDRAIRHDRLGQVRFGTEKDRQDQIVKSLGGGAARPRPQSQSDKRERSIKFQANLEKFCQEQKVSTHDSYSVELESFVKARNDPWRDLGIGIVRRLGKTDDTVWVQFDVTGDQWLLKCEDLEIVPDPGKAKFGKCKRKVFDA
mmetsp:Transcript_103713/g.163776  ORF Transcript_103713/g.163776 Transcript_103713/m.163776 type:complete len:479 (+) Transcript_103713:50-1486(+)